MGRKVKGKCDCSKHPVRKDYGVKFCSNCRKILKYEDHGYPEDRPINLKRKKRIKRS